MTPLERITERVNRHGDVNRSVTPRPLLTLEEFFEGNDRAGSICCNLSPMPAPADVYAILRRLRERADVADVRVQVTQFDDPQWPFSDTVWIITTATPQEVKSWFDKSIAPDRTWSGWRKDMIVEPLDMPAGMQPVACWWD
jgi:hypothetical protein